MNARTLYLILAKSFAAFDHFRRSHPELAPTAQYVPNAEALQGRVFDPKHPPKVIVTSSWTTVSPITRRRVEEYILIQSGVKEEDYQWL